MVDPQKIDFEVISMSSKDDWPNVISQFHVVKKIEHADGPLWRFILGQVDTKENRNNTEQANEYVLLFQFHHAIIDGKSASDLMCHQLLPILSAVANGHDAENMFPFVPQTKSLEGLFVSKERLQNPVPWYVRLRASVLRWKNRILKPAEIPVFRFSDENVPTEELQHGPVCVPKIFGQEISESVIKAAKSNGVTVHSVLLVAGAMAFSRTADAARVKLPETFRQMWAIDLRKFLDFETPQPVGVIASFTFTLHHRASDCDPDAFWQSCKQTYLAVKTESNKDKITSTLGIVKYFLAEIAGCEYEIALKEMRTEYIIALSNLGNLSVDQEPAMTDCSTKIHMTEQFFCLSGPTAFNPFFQSMITFRGKFMWSILHHPTKVSRKFIAIYYNNLEDVLGTFCVQENV